MKKRDIIYFLFGLIFWFTAQFFMLNFFSFEDFLVNYVLKITTIIWNLLPTFAFISWLLIVSFKKIGKLKARANIIGVVKNEIDNLYKRMIQVAFWFPLPESYKVGSKNLKNIYTILWASFGFFTYFFLNASFNVYLSVGFFSFKFILLVVLSSVFIISFVWFSFATLLTFFSYYLGMMVKLIDLYITELATSRIKKLAIENYKFIRPIFKSGALVMGILYFLSLLLTLAIAAGLILNALSNVEFFMISETALEFFEINFEALLKEKLVFYLSSFLLVYSSLVLVGNRVLKPNEWISDFLKKTQELVNSFDETTSEEERYKAITLLEYCTDFFPHTLGFYSLPSGLRVGFYLGGWVIPKMHFEIIDILSRKMEYLRNELKKLSFEIRYRKKQEDYNSILTKLNNFEEIMADEKYELLNEMDYEPWNYFKRVFETFKIMGALVVFIDRKSVV